MTTSMRWIICGLLFAGSVGQGPLAGAVSGTQDPPGKKPVDIVKPLIDARKFDEAEKMARELLAAAETIHGPESLETGEALDALTNVLLTVSDPSIDELRLIAGRAVAVKEVRLGRRSLEFVVSLLNLFRFNLKVGNYEQARACATEAVATRKALLGPRHFEVGKALNNLAVVLVRMGEYDDARPIYDDVISIYREVGAPEFPDIATVMNNLGVLYNRTNDPASARRLFEDVLRIQETAFGPDSPQIGGTLGNLAVSTYELEDYAACRRYWERVKALWAKDPGTETSAYAAALGNLGRTLLELGQTDEGARLIDQALAIHEKLNLMQAREVPGYQNYKAYALALQGHMQAARDYYQRALDRQRQLLGPDHPTVARYAFDLAEHLFRMGDLQGALDQALMSERVTRTHLHQTFPALSERQAIHLEMARRPSIDLSLTILLDDRPETPLPDANKRVWDSVVRSRALVLDEMTARARDAAGPGPGGDKGPAEKLAVARRKVSRMLVLGPGNKAPEKFQEDLNQAVEQRESAERDLAQASAPFGRHVARSQVGLDKVIESVPADMGLVAYVKFERSGRAAGEHSEWYLALTLDTGTHGIRVVPIGAAAEVESAIESWRQEAGSDPRAGDVEQRSRAYLQAAQRLRSLLWDPAWSTLHGSKRVVVVPDGAISLVNIATLADRDGKYLVETGPTLHYVASERDLALDQRPRAEHESLLIVGGPDFDASPAGARAVASAVKPEPKGPAAIASFRRPRSSCGAFSDLLFDPLPQAREEADEVARLWTGEGDVRKLTGLQADEATLKSAAPHAQIIHLSTHAFFMAGKCGASKDESGKSAGGGTNLEYRTMTLPADFLVFSGLALAGANRRQIDAASDGAAEDGILTAEEISALDLSETHWVVLSACETGLGKYLRGEGVLGLRRAFESASAGTLIMSLWQVEDSATRAWMTSLYRNRLAGLDTAESVRNASLELLGKHDRTHALRHPFFWGAFIASGDWR